MARRRIGQEHLRLGDRENGRTGSLYDLHRLIDWTEIDRHLAPIYASEKCELAWPPLALFKALLLAVSGLRRMSRRPSGRPTCCDR
jgi:IS5 family transposase